MYIYIFMNNNFDQLEDFIADDSFLSWVYKTDETNIAQWETWLANNPGKKALATEAANLALQIRLTEASVSGEQLDAATTRLTNTMEAEKQNSPAKVIGMRRRKIWYSVAAAAIILAVLTFSLRYVFNGNSKPQLATTYGQIRQDRLPDGTEVTLNANSKITYPKQWKEGTDREVWINGEAFFHVKKTPHRDKFIVHTDAFDIEVTGTSFDVINRNGKSSIVLKEGSVKIHRPGEEVIFMKPGDFVEFAEKQIHQKTISKQDYLAWTENKLVFDNTTLTEFAAIVKEHYGIEVKLEGEGLAERTISGIMPNDNLDILLQTLEATQDFSIQRSKTAITITNKTSN